MGFNGLGFSGGGFGQALGAATPSQADGVAAYGSVWASNNCPPCNVTIINMQTQLVRVAGLMGLTPSTGVDGRVGAGTVSTLQGVSSAAAQRGLAWGVGLGMYANAELIARNADKILGVLSQVTSIPGAAPPASRPGTQAGQVVTYTPPPAATPGTNITPGAALVPATTSGIPMPYLIGGGILFAGVVIAAVILMTPSKHAAV